MKDDPYHDRKIVHKAKLIGPDGKVSPMCATTPRAINPKLASWTLRWEAVTCPKCKKLRTTDSNARTEPAEASNT